MEFHPLNVKMRLGNSQLLASELLHLDAVLSSAVLQDATRRTNGIEDESKVYYIPLPVVKLWSAPDGLPLWATSDFFPLGEEHRSTVILHKRQHPSFVQRTGPYMNTRVPKQTAITDTGWWQARCFGNKDEIERLLNTYIHSVGKHRNDGFGLVHEWDIEVAEFAPLDTVICDGVLIRPVPEFALEHFDFIPSGAPYQVNWTQPYWKPRNRNYGWRAGTIVEFTEIDYFDAV